MNHFQALQSIKFSELLMVMSFTPTCTRYYIPQQYNWEKIRFHPKEGLGEFITTAMRKIAGFNKNLSGILTLKDYNEKQHDQRVLDDDKLSDLIEVISPHHLGLKNANADREIGDILADLAGNCSPPLSLTRDQGFR